MGFKPRTKDRNDNAVTTVIVIHLYLMICKIMLVSTSVTFNSFNGILNLVCIALLLLLYLFLFADYHLAERIPVKAWGVVCLVAFFITGTFILDPERFFGSSWAVTWVRSQLMSYFAYCLPLFLSVSAVRDFDLLMEKLYRFSVVPFFFSCIGFALTLVDPIDSYSMSYGYATMLVVMVSMLSFEKKHRFFDFAMAVLGTAFIFTAGSRAPLVGIAAGLVFIFFRNKMTPVKTMLLALAVFVGAFVLLNFNTVLNLIEKVCSAFGISSRTVRLLLSGAITNDSGRAAYHNAIYEALRESRGFGLGAFAGEAVTGLSHSLYLDFFANFGYVCGGLFILYIVFHSVRLLHEYRGTDLSAFLLLFISIAAPTGFFGYEFWACKELWIIFAVFVNCSARKEQCVLSRTLPVKNSLPLPGSVWKVKSGL